MKCPVNSDDIRSITQKALYRKNKLPINEQIKIIQDTFTKEFLQNYNTEDFGQIAESILTVANDKGLTGKDSNFFNQKNLEQELLNTQLSVKHENTTPLTTDILENTPQIRTRREASLIFLTKAYGTANEVYNAIHKRVSRNLFDCLFCNRGSIEDVNIGIIPDNATLNSNIRVYQNKLLGQICEYIYEDCLKQAKSVEISKEVKDILKNPKMYENGKYTGALEILAPYISSYLHNMKGQTDSIRDSYNKSKDSTIDSVEKQKEVRKINAFNALNLLENFDSFLSDLLSKSIIINNFGIFSDTDKYSVSEKSANVFTTWRKDDNINPEKEVDFIVKLAINTTPLLRWGSNTETGDFLKFSDFQSIIAKIKDLPYNEECSSIIFDEKFQRNYKDGFWDNLSLETQSLIKNLSLHTIITRLRADPRKYFSCVFEILSNQKFKNITKTLYSSFRQDELNKLWSINKGLFNGDTSLRNLCKNQVNNNYYDYLVQTADSIFNVHFLQHYKDENGVYHLRRLIDQSFNNIKRQVEEQINLSNTYKLISDWNKYKEEYNIQCNVNKETKNITIFQFMIPNSDIQVSVYPSTGVVKMFKGGEEINYKDEFNSLKTFIDKQLNLNLENNIALQENLIEEYNGISQMSEGLGNFAARVLLHKYIQREYLLNKNGNIKSNKNTIINNIYGERQPKWNYVINELGMVHALDVDNIKVIARAKANITGISNSTLVKNTEGKSQSAQSLSRLLGSILSQFELIEKTPNSATNSFCLLITPGLFEGIYTNREFSDSTKDFKDTTQMNVAEMTAECFLYDFVGGLTDQDNIVGNGHVMFLPSVNADKNTIGRIKINLNKIVNGKPLLDYSNSELQELISQEFGTFYEKVVQNIQQDWKTLYTFIVNNIEFSPEINDKEIPNLENDYLSGFVRFNSWFNNNKQFIKGASELSAVDFIKLKTYEYNKNHRLNPLELIDQVHYKENKGFLSINETIPANLFRFKPGSKIFEKYNNQFGVEYNVDNIFPTAGQFWQRKKLELLRSLIRNNAIFDLSNQNQIESKYLKDKYSNWVNKSNKLIFAKVQHPEYGIIEVTSEVDFLKYDINYFNLLTQQDCVFELNPLLEQYNYLEYLFTQEFMNSSVGSFIAHVDKTKSSNVLEQESGQFGAQHKRNVSMTAQMHEFLINKLDGIPDTYNIAVIKDLKDFQGTITGLNNEIKPFDGATFVNPFIVHLENKSLCGAKAGITKKQFVHFKNARTGTGGIIKTAGFGLTNDWIRNSPFLMRMMENMTNHIWLNEDGTEADVNILKDYRGNKITTYNQIYFRSTDGNFYTAKIEKVENEINTYQRSIAQVDYSGNVIGEWNLEEPQVINTNFSLWNLFGGAYSMELKNGSLFLSETSVINVVTAMNNCKSEDFETPNIVETQSDLWQPLKMVDVHYLATEGAVKQGGANINAIRKYEDTEGYDIQRIKLYQIGIQLDKEHHADESELSLMTQVASACAAKGYTFEAAVRLYDALSKITEINTQEFLNPVLDLFNTGNPNSRFKLQEVLYKSIIKLLETSNSQNFITDLAKEIMAKARNGNEINFSEQIIPLSDNNIYAKVVSTVNSYLTKTGIKQKIPGILSVLTPSHNIMKLYAGRKYDSFTNPEEELKVLQEVQAPTFSVDLSGTSITDIELGRNYFITVNEDVELIDEFGNIYKTIQRRKLPESIPIKNIDQYNKLKQDVKNGIVVEVTEDIISGRELAGYNVRFQAISEDSVDEFGKTIPSEVRRFQLYDLDSYQTLFKLNELKQKQKRVKSSNDIIELISELSNLYSSYYNRNIPEELTFNDTIKYFERNLNRDLQHNLNALTKQVPVIFEQYQDLLSSFEDNSNWYKLYTQWVNIQLQLGNGSKIDYNGTLIDVNSKNFQEINDYVQKIIKHASAIRIGGKFYNVDRSSLKIQPYEVIMPKIFATIYGLKEFDSLEEIEKDPEWFVKQYEKNLCKLRSNQYDVVFTSSSNNNIYVLDTKSLPSTTGITQVSNIKTDIEDGVTMLLDDYDKPLFEIQENDKIYIDSKGNKIIVTNNIKFYADTLSYDSIKLSPNLQNRPDFLKELPETFKESKNKTAKAFGKAIYSKTKDIKEIISNSNNFNKPVSGSRLYKNLVAKHTSFLRALDVIAARIPAQCMQSYMPMRVVAFDNPNINTAYVSTYQILLQGSDYDIDAVSLAAFDVDSNGILQLWSPYSNLQDPQLREASEELPIPTGKKVKDWIARENESALSRMKQIFEKYDRLFNISEKTNWDELIRQDIINLHEINFEINNNTVEELHLLKDFLENIDSIPSLNGAEINDFKDWISFRKNTIFTYDQVESILKNIRKAIDKHNLYFDNISKTKITKIANNQIMKGMWDTSIAPCNLTQAQVPIDVVTEPLKEIAETRGPAHIIYEAKQRTSGNFINKLESIEENQVGKDGIAICATGLKTFFALTQYYNYILNFGTAEQQERLKIGNTGFILSGVRAINPKTIINPDILEILASLTNDTDNVLTLSALLSLSTDNAKELKLAKLNAGKNTLGMYIFGTSIGIDFEQIAEVMMSESGFTLSKALNANIYAEQLPLRSITNAISHFTEKCDLNVFQQYSISLDPGTKEKIRNPVNVFKNAFNAKNGYDKKLDLGESLITFVKGSADLQSALTILEELRGKYESKSSYGIIKYNQLIDSVEEYVVSSYRMIHDSETIKKLDFLARGASEMKLLGQILGINQGLKSDIPSYFKQIKNIEDLLYNASNHRLPRINLQRFVFDKDYREDCINKYEKFKVAFNILDVISSVPNFFKYIQTLAVSQRTNEESFKFRSTEVLFNIYSKYNYDKNAIYRGIQNFIGDFIRDSWLKIRNLQLENNSILMPEGFSSFDSSGELNSSDVALPIELGTEVGNANFRIFMETKVIPDLKEGKITKDKDKIVPHVKNNKFVSDLTQELLTHTVSQEASIVYSLPINMMPHSNVEEDLLNSYISEFNKLAQYSYEYEVTVLRDGKLQKEIRIIPLSDLFTYYAMIAYDWKPGEKSLVPILKSFQNKTLLNDFHEYESSLDKGTYILDEMSLNSNDIYPYIVPRGNPYTSWNPIIRYKNPNSKRVRLMRHLTKEEMDLDEEELGATGNYVYIGESLNTNYFTTGIIKSEILLSEYESVSYLNYKDKENNVTVAYSKGNNGISLVNLIVNDVDITKKYKRIYKTLPSCTVDGKPSIATNELNAYINHILNPC